jgi:hypothetical protein
MAEFKPGDKVRILGTTNLYGESRFAPGTIHTVLSCDECYCRVNPNQPNNGYRLHSFELVEKIKSNKKETGWGF